MYSRVHGGAKTKEQVVGEVIFAICVLTAFGMTCVSLVIEFMASYAHVNGLVNEAKMLMESVCALSSSDLSNHIIDCAEAKRLHATNVLLRAVELTMQNVLRNTFNALKNGIGEISHAIGIVGFIGFMSAYVLSLFVRAIWGSRYNCHTAYSATSMERNQAVITLPNTNMAMDMDMGMGMDMGMEADKFSSPHRNASIRALPQSCVCYIKPSSPP